MPRRVKSIFYRISKNGDPDSFLFGTIHAVTHVTKNFTPWNSEHFKSVQQVVTEMIGLLPEILDGVILQEAHTAKKEIVGLESPARTIELISKFNELMSKDPEFQELELELHEFDGSSILSKTIQLYKEFGNQPEKVKELNLSEKVKARLIKELKNVDDAINAYVTQSPVDNEPSILHEEMIVKRNQEWMEKLPDLLKISSFIAVGYGHLHGDKGLISLLENVGFTLTPEESPRISLEHEINFDKVMKELKNKKGNFHLNPVSPKPQDQSKYLAPKKQVKSKTPAVVVLPVSVSDSPLLRRSPRRSPLKRREHQAAKVLQAEAEVSGKKRCCRR